MSSADTGLPSVAVYADTVAPTIAMWPSLTTRARRVGDILRVGAVQLTTSDDRERNVRVAAELVARAAAAGAKLVVLPEKWHYIHDSPRPGEGAEPLVRPPV